MNDESLRQLSPEDQNLSETLQSGAESVQINPHFQTNLESQLKQSHPANKQPKGARIKILPALGWAIVIIGAFLILDWAVRSLAPAPQPAADGTPNPNVQFESTPTAETSAAPELPIESETTPTPSGTEYAWRGTKLYLDAPLPGMPVEANLYQLSPEQPATAESARALAQRFGIQGEVYQAPGDLPDTTQFLVTDGQQRLYVRSEQYFLYYTDYANYSTDMFSFHEPLQQDEVAKHIDAFLKSHGYDFTYQIENAPQLINDYYVVPLSSDGFPLRYDYLMPVRLEIKLDVSGQVIFLQSNLIAYEQIGTFGIRTAQEAWERVLHENGAAGMQEGMRGAGILKEYFWKRSYPDNQTVTIYDRVNSFPPADPAGTPFVSIGDQTVTGNIAGLEAIEGNRLVEASGQFSTENGVRRFHVDSWKVSDAVETAVSGSLNREGEHFILSTHEGNQYTLADVPSDIPLEAQTPGTDLNIDGVLVNGSLEWRSIQYFPSDGPHGGGGGGGGLGFYKLNLTGTPVPLPTPQIPQETKPRTGNYVVQEGDTLTAIAEANGITVDELMQLNGLTDATIFIGQELVIPGVPPEPSPVGQKIEGQRGIAMVEIYRQTDGSQQTIYRLLSPQSSQYNYFQLIGDGLEGLEKYHNRPVDIWGTIESVDINNGIVVNVERYEVPFPDLQFQILRGTQEQVTLDGQEAILFTTKGQTYVQFSLAGDIERSIVGNPGDEVLAEALILPGESFGGYPAVRVYSLALAINPKNGQPMDMQVGADQPFVIDGPVPGDQLAAPPTATIEKVELVYYTPDTRYRSSGNSTSPVYLQPIWRFYGHYSEGSEFEILIQALKDEYLLPEVETVEPPG